MKNIFSDEETSELDTMGVPDESEIDNILEEVDQQEEEPVTYMQKTQNKPVASKQPTNPAYKLSNNEMSVIQAAMVQLDQARLYEMFLNHNLFEGVKANPAALKNVEKELKDFILERLQILLGMKQEKKQVDAPPQKVKMELPFNDIEIDFLKALAFKGTKGESAKAPASKIIESQGISPIKQVQPETFGLKKIGSTPQYREEQEHDEDEDEEELPLKAAPKPVVKKQPQPQPKPQQKARKPMSEKELIEQIAREDLERMNGRKPASQMSASELLEASKNATSSPKKKSAKALPMPDADALAMHYQMQQLKKPANGGTTNFVDILSKKMGFSTNQIQQVGDEE